MSEMLTDRWFIAQLKPQGLRLAQENIARQGFQSFCPKRTESVIRGSKRSTKLLPLFPGYLFVRVETKQSPWTSLNATRGISRMILADPRAPRALPEPFMAGLLARCDAAGMIGTPPDISVGDRIRILSGPFSDMVSRIETLEPDARVSILLSFMGREVRTTIPAQDIEKL